MYSMAVTGAADTVGAEDDFGLIQEVRSLFSSVVSRRSAIAVLLSLQLALQIVENMLKFANVAPPLELGRTSHWLPSISWL